MKNLKIINNIIGRDRVFGVLAEEAQMSFEGARFTASLACLFVLMEQSVKRYLEIDEFDKRSLFDITSKAKSEGVLGRADFAQIDCIRQLRNKLFHANHYSHSLEVDGIEYPMDEDSSKELIFNMYHKFIYDFCLRSIDKIT